MNFSAPFIHRPIATALLMAGLLLGGLVAYRLLPVAALPSVNYPTIQVTAQFPGANPQTMASTVATPLEQQFTTLKAIVHFYNTRDVLPRCQLHDAGEGTSCWPASESTDNMNTTRVGNLGLSSVEEDALVSFMQTLTDGFMPRD